MVPITLLCGLVHRYFRYDAFTYRIVVHLHLSIMLTGNVTTKFKLYDRTSYLRGFGFG